MDPIKMLKKFTDFKKEFHDLFNIIDSINNDNSKNTENNSENSSNNNKKNKLKVKNGRINMISGKVNIINNKQIVNSVDIPNLKIPISIDLAGDDHDGIIDTGSNHTIIEEIYMSENSELGDCNLMLSGPSDEELEVLGKTFMEIEIKGKKFNGKFVVVKHLSCGIILGNDFLIQNHGIIGFDEGMIQLGSRHKKNLLKIEIDPEWMLKVAGEREDFINAIKTKEVIIIKPKQSKLLDIKLPKKLREKLDKNEIKFDPLPEFEKYAGIFPKFEIDEKRNKIYKNLLNYKNKTQKILKDTCVGNFKDFENFKNFVNFEKSEIDEKIKIKYNDNGDLCDSEGTPFIINKNLTKDQKSKVEKLIIKYYDVFTTNPLNVQTANIEPYKIRLCDEEPLAMKCYKLSV